MYKRQLVLSLVETLCTRAAENRATIMPGYTHMQRAQPVTFGHHLMAYAMMLLRDLGRLDDCRKRMNVSPIGCCALAGTTYPVDRRAEAASLGFDGIAMNSLDGVSDRDSVSYTHLDVYKRQVLMQLHSPPIIEV